jgi:hypothetical protein
MLKGIKTPKDKKTLSCRICDFLDKWLHLDKLIDLLCEEDYDEFENEGLMLYGGFYS